MKYHIGDIVTVQAIVENDRSEIDGTVQCRFAAPRLVKLDHHQGGQDIVFCVREKDIVGHTPKPIPLQAGDTVRVSNLNNCRFDMICTILAIHNNHAWVELTTGTTLIISLKDLERLS